MSERKVVMKRMSVLVAICVLLVGVGCGVTQTAQSGTAAQRTKLQQDTEMQGYLCAKGYAMVYPSGHLASCSVSRETVFGEALIPAGSIIDLDWAGKPKGAMMAHNTVIAGVKCGGGNWLLGPSEGAATGFYPNGKLKICFLAGDQSVQGVPCMAAGFIGLFGDGARRDGGAKFYESGKLESCTLAKDYGGKRRGEHFQQGQ
jgi:hypothetical protein